MGRRIGIAVGTLLLLVAAVLTFAVINLNSYLDDNRDWLAEQVEAAVGRPVSFERIGVSFMGGLGVEITQLAVGDDPAFSDDAFIRADEVMVLVRPWPAASPFQSGWAARSTT